MTAAVGARPAGIVRWAALGGVASAILFVIGVILFYGSSPDSGSAPAKIIAWYSDSGHRDRLNFGWLVAGLGLFCFIWFVGALRQTVRRLEGEDGLLTSLTTIGGAVYATLALAALAINTGIRTMSDDTYQHQVYPGILHAADDAAWVVHASGGAGAATMILAATIAGMRARAIPGWAGWLSIVAGVLSLALVIFFPWFVLALWVLVVSIGLFVRAGRTPAVS